MVRGPTEPQSISFFHCKTRGP
uniref:Uncharacterized protein n=1 Tax=Anguilla anguilla TaxID=7936 RepID=A0A0E9TNL9_ANGAN